MQSRTIFALDIGTRKVMGVVAERRGDMLEILESETQEHPTRAMSAGQIQDVPKVTQVVRQVVRALSERSGLELRDVAVAVAGRNLKTVVGNAAMNCPKDRVLETGDVEQLTFDALESALRRLGRKTANDQSKIQHSCVGYVVRRYLLEGIAIAQPVGHQGDRLEVEVLATFLPRQVLESQIDVLESAGLEVASVTLEPIAALQATISPDLRRLDLALVDIGAGTSDIALVSEGAVCAFAMVPYAGDSITERICGQFLLEFNEAEKMKREISGGGVIKAADIFQQPLRLTSQEVRGAIAPAVAELASRIAGGILELSGGKAPQGVLCVGGGSRTPGLLEMLAQALEIPLQRVGIRSPEGMRTFKDMHGGSLGPETATPLGIAEVASVEGGVCFKKIFINDKRFFLLDIGRPMTVLSALMASGIAAKKIFGWPGVSKTYTVNGEFRIFQARAVSPARVELNGMPVDSNTPIAAGDRISFVAACEHEEAAGTVGDALGNVRRMLAVNGHLRDIAVRVVSNGRLVDCTEPLSDRMRLTIEGTRLRDVLTPTERSHRYFRLNDRAVDLNALVQHGDKAEVIPEFSSTPIAAPARTRQDVLRPPLYDGTDARVFFE
ncbi:MAG: cell division FtsA domain-containing protein [Elusimicrobiota bacterium]